MAALTGSIAIAYLNQASGKTVTATTSATGYPATNLSTSLLSQAWRSTSGSLTSQFLTVDLGSSKDIEIIALVGVNLSDAATRTPLTSDTSDFSVLEYNPGSASVFDLTWPALVSDASRYGRNLIVLPGVTHPTLNSRYVSVSLSNAGIGNPPNYLSARVYWVGSLWQPTYSYAGQPDTFRKRAETIGEPGMERFIRFLDVDLHCLSEAEGRALESLCLARLRTGRLFVLMRPTQPASFQSEAIYCTLVGMPVLSAWPQGGGLNFWKVKLTFRECED